MAAPGGTSWRSSASGAGAAGAGPRARELSFQNEARNILEHLKCFREPNAETFRAFKSTVKARARRTPSNLF